MTPTHTTILLMAGLLVLINSPSGAQEQKRAVDSAAKAVPAPSEAPAASTHDSAPVPGPTQPQKSQQTPPAPEPAEAPPPHSRPSGARHASPPEEPTPFVGLLTSPVAPELRAQLGIAPGFGLQVVEVMPNSPAQEAGVKEHDVLLAMDDQKLVNMEQFQTLVRARKKGDEILLTVISGGKQSQARVRVGERLMPVHPTPLHGHPYFGAHSPRPHRPGDQTRDNMKRFQERMRDYQEQLQKWMRDGRQGAMPQPPAFDSPQPSLPHHRHGGGERDQARRDEGHRNRHDSNSRRELHENVSITRRDDTGEYSLQRHDGKTQFSVRTKAGEQQSWTFSSPEERAAIPEQYRDQLRLLEELGAGVHAAPGAPDHEAGRKPEKGGARQNTPPPPHPSLPSPRDGNGPQGDTL